MRPRPRAGAGASVADRLQPTVFDRVLHHPDHDRRLAADFPGAAARAVREADEGRVPPQLAAVALVVQLAAATDQVLKTVRVKEAPGPDGVVGGPHVDAVHVLPRRDVDPAPEPVLRARVLARAGLAPTP